MLGCKHLDQDVTIVILTDQALQSNSFEFLQVKFDIETDFFFQSTPHIYFHHFFFQTTKGVQI